MGRVFRVISLIVLAASVTHAQHITGTFNTSISGRPVTTEEFVITAGADQTIKAEAEITAGGVKQKKITIVAANRPVSYSIEAQNTKQLSVEFSSSGVIAQAGATRREISSKASVILDNLVWHHYLFLLRQYDAGKGGKQTFTAFLPTAARDLEVSVEKTESRMVATAGQSIAVNHFRVELGGQINEDIWADATNLPLLILIQSQGVQVLRLGLETVTTALLSELQPSAANESFSSEEVTFQNGALRLAGTLTLPKSGAAHLPAAVLISGTGAQDRDENPGGYSLFRLIAERLSSNGVAVLRHDDRAVGKSAAPGGPTTYRDLIADTQSAIAYLRGRKEIDADRIIVIGHSEGAETAAIIAAEDARIYAVALLAGLSQSLDKALEEQVLYGMALGNAVEAGDRDVLPQLPRQLLQTVSDAKAGKQDTSRSDVYEYFRQHAASDPLANIRRARCPVLILQGERDTNVLAYHAVALATAAVAAGNHKVMLRIFPNLAHTFTPSSLDRCPSGESRATVSAEFLDTLQKWVASALKQAGHSASKPK